MTDVFASLSRLSNWQSILDLALVTLVFYGLFRLFSGTRAVQLVRGVLVFIIIFAILAQTIDLPAFNWLMRTASPMVLVAIPVIFQPELRRALERVGRSAPLLTRRGDTSQAQSQIAEIVKSVDWPHGITWQQAAAQKLVDPFFPSLVSTSPPVRWLNGRQHPLQIVDCTP